MSTISQHTVQAASGGLRYSFSCPYCGPSNFVCNSERVVSDFSSQYPDIQKYSMRVLVKSGILSPTDMNKVLQKAEVELANGIISDDEVRYFAERIVAEHKSLQNRKSIRAALNGTCLGEVVRKHMARKESEGILGFMSKNDYEFYN